MEDFISREKAKLDEFYDESSETYKKVISKLKTLDVNRLKEDILHFFAEFEIVFSNDENRKFTPHVNPLTLQTNPTLNFLYFSTHCTMS